MYGFADLTELNTYLTEKFPDQEGKQEFDGLSETQQQDHFDWIIFVTELTRHRPRDHVVKARPHAPHVGHRFDILEVCHLLPRHEPV